MISIDDELCIGCGLCESSLPQYFVVENGLVKVRKGEVAPEHARELGEVAEDCPAQAIQIDLPPV